MQQLLVMSCGTITELLTFPNSTPITAQNMGSRMSGLRCLMSSTACDRLVLLRLLRLLLQLLQLLLGLGLRPVLILIIERVIG